MLSCVYFLVVSSYTDGLVQGALNGKDHDRENLEVDIDMMHSVDPQQR